MDIFENSVLSELEDNVVKKDTYIPGIDSNFSENDMKLWWEKKAVGDVFSQDSTTFVQEKIFDILQRYASDCIPGDKLVNTDMLEQMGLNKPLINLLLNYTCAYHEGNKDKTENLTQKSGDQKFHNIFMSIFLNTHGACRSHDLINALAMSIDIRKHQKIDTLVKNQIETDELSKMTIHDVIKKCQQNHITNSSVKNVLISKVDSIKKQIADTIMCKIPDDETFLTAVARSFVEPNYAIQKFEKCVVHHHFYPGNKIHKSKLETLMKSHTVNLKNNFQTLRKELFQIVLPFSWTLTDTDSTTVLDILLNIMFGCNAKHIRAFVETIEFTFVTKITSSDRIMKNVEEMINNNKFENAANETVLEYMIKVWKKTSAFIIFLDLFRTIFTENRDLTIGKVDHMASHEINKSGDRSISLDNIYFHKGIFYVAISNKMGSELRLKTDNFYELFYQVLKFKDKIIRDI